MYDFQKMYDPMGFRPEARDYEVDNTAMCFDERHRKLYIADALGIVRCFNVNSGALIKILVTNTEEHLAVNEIEIVAIRHFQLAYNDSSILITAHCNKTLKAWDVTEDGKSCLIKVSKGGHFGAHVSVMTFSTHLCLLATGTHAGDVTVWDFETFRPIGFL